MRTILTLTLSLLAYPAATDAYVGPGLGMGALGALLGGLVAVLLGLAGVLWYPLKRFFRRRKGTAPADTAGDAEASSEAQADPDT